MARVRFRTYVSKIIIAAFLLTMVWCPVKTQAAEPTDLSISQAIEMALKSDPDIKTMALTVEKAQKARDDAAQAVTFTPISGAVDVGTQTIYLAFKSAEISLGAAKMQQKLLPQQITKEIITSYIGLVNSQNSIDLQKVNIAKLEKQIAASKVAKDNGMVSDSDWQTLQNTLAQQKESLKQAETSLISSKLAFNTAIGQNKEAQINLTSVPAAETVAMESIDNEYKLVLANSVDVWRAQQNLDIENMKQNWAMLNTDSTNKRISLDQAAITLDTTKTSTRTSFETMYYGIQTLESSMASTKQAYDQAKADLKTAETKYQLGMIPLLSTSGTGDLTSARLTAESKRISLETLKQQIVNSKSNLYLATGRTVFDESDWATRTGSSVNLGLVNDQSAVTGRVTFTIGKTSYTIGTKSKTIEVAPYIKNGRTYVPIRYLGDAIGAKVDWNPSTKTAALTKNGKSIALVIGDYSALANGKYINMEVAPEIYRGRTMLPARYVTEALGNTISWDEKSKEIAIY